MTHKLLIENGMTVCCEECGSDNVIAVEPFDYIKMCMNDGCLYYADHLEKLRYQFMTGVHN